MRAHRGERRRRAEAGARAACKPGVGSSFFHSQAIRLQRAYRPIVFDCYKNGQPYFRGLNRGDRRQIMWRKRAFEELAKWADSWATVPIAEWGTEALTPETDQITVIHASTSGTATGTA